MVQQQHWARRGDPPESFQQLANELLTQEKEFAGLVRITRIEVCYS